jgi:hypothetical protein
MLDPIQIKKSSAAKMRLADKTGNIALRKEAAAEQVTNPSSLYTFFLPLFYQHFR